MSVRSIIKVGKKKHYATRKKSGRFASISNIAKSIKWDSRTKSKKVAKPGHGHEGDLKKRRPATKKAVKKITKKKTVKKK